MGIEVQFKKIFLEIENLEKKINNKEWSIIFEKNQYLLENLMKSPNYYNIYNFTREIGDDIIGRYTKGMISADEDKVYQQQRHKIDYELHRVHLLIEELDRNFWIDTKDTLEEFQNKIMCNLPKDPKKPFWKSFIKLFSRLWIRKPKYLKAK